MIQTDNLFLISSMSFIIAYFFSFYFSKKKLLIDDKNYSGHKQLTQSISKSIPLCGGIIIFTCSLIFFQDLFYLNIFGFLLLMIGVFSDSNKISSPSLRILFQLIIFIIFIIFTNFNLIDLRVDFLNELLTIKPISIIFTTFCILVLVNGSNFLDGLNTLVVGYYILICSFLLVLSSNYNLVINDNIILLLIFLIIVYLFNLFGKFYLGDSGSYLVSFYISYFVIEFALNNQSVSPYLICFFLWYPAFENLFSILRKINLKRSPINPDTNHLHQLIYAYYVKRNFTQLSANNITSIAINAYNAFVVIISLLNPS